MSAKAFNFDHLEILSFGKELSPLNSTQLSFNKIGNSLEYLARFRFWDSLKMVY